MLTKQIVAIATLFAAAAASAADTVPSDLLQQQQSGVRSRAEVAQETRQALAAGEIKHGPLADMYAAVSPAPAAPALAQRSKKEGEAKVDLASAPASVKK